jgi:gephyrin
MLSVEDALQEIQTHTPSPQITRAKVDENLIGHVLAEDVIASENVPAFRASIVDGYAIIASTHVLVPSTKGIFPVVSISHAKPGSVPELVSGEVSRITTGAPLPPGATAVVMVEDTILRSLTPDGKEEYEIEILTDETQPGENVREIGSDVRAGEVILRKGQTITAEGGELGLLASVGTVEVKVFRKPVVGVLSTGDEIINHDQRPGELRLGEVRDTNRPTLLALVRAQGFEAVDLGIASDR